MKDSSVLLLAIMLSTETFRIGVKETIMPLCSTKCDSEENSDVTFFVGPEMEKYRIPGHKSVLTAASPVFHAMFEGPLAEGCEVNIKDVEYRAFDNLLKFIYGQRVQLQSVDTALSTLYAAHKYNCEGLENFCLDYLSKHVDTSCVLAIHHDMSMYCNYTENYQNKEQWNDSPVPSAPSLDVIENSVDCNHDVQVQNSSVIRKGSQTVCNLLDRYKALLNECLLFIDLHADDVLLQEQFDDLNKEDLLLIAQRETLGVSSEMILFKALQRWCKYRCKRNHWELSTEKYRYALGKELLFSVRYLLMSSEEFMNGPMISKLLTPEECNFLLGHILNHSCIPNVPEYLRSMLPRLGTKRRKMSSLSSTSSPYKLSIAKNLKSLCSSSESSSKAISKHKKPSKKQKERVVDQTQIQEVKPNMSDYLFSCIACIFD